MVQSTLKHKRECLNTLGMGGHLPFLLPPLIFALWQGKRLKLGKTPATAVLPHPVVCFPVYANTTMSL